VRRLAAASLLALALGASALARDTAVKLTLDGRPVDREGGIALEHQGVVYADVVDLVKAFDGLLTFHGKTVVVTLSGTTAAFTAGSRTARLGLGAVTMRGRAFERKGDLYVPLDFFVTQVAHARVRIDKSFAHADIFVNANPLS
jgi:Copper amine oxidase N-terminal domain